MRDQYVQPTGLVESFIDLTCRIAARVGKKKAVGTRVILAVAALETFRAAAGSFTGGLVTPVSVSPQIAQGVPVMAHLPATVHRADIIDDIVNTIGDIINTMGSGSGTKP